MTDVNYTLDEIVKVLTETQEGITMPADYSFETVNDYVHGVGVQFEEMQALCLGMSSEIERLQALLNQAPVALMDTRSALGVCALAEEDFPALYALHGKRVKLVVDAGQLKHA